MSDLLLKSIAFLTMLVFVGVLIFHVPRWDLGIVIGLTMLAAAWDFFVPARKR